ncbi:MAG TPA: hypothetical protein VNR88_09230 [Hyphomicrobium sp.]|nr:hypothetical protein [Hyphomicrobium sp.]
MAANEKTSAAVAKIASKGLKAPGTLTHAEIKKLAASALTQAADVPKPAAAKKTVKRKVASKPVKAKPVKARAVKAKAVKVKAVKKKR